MNLEGLLKGIEQEFMKCGLKSRENTELNDLSIIICVRKPEVFVERISVWFVNEKLVRHGIHVCHAPMPVASWISNHSHLEFILVSKCRRQDVILPRF